jgi:HNH endonuclease
MFDNERTSSVFTAVSPSADVAASPAEPARVPLERLEAQICELAGHLAAATCRFLVLLSDFDARRGWASWEMNSCAQWLSWKCQMSSGTARVTHADDEAARVQRRLTWRLEEDGSLSGTFRLPPLQGAVLLKALRAACADLAGGADDRSAGVSAETPAAADAPAADAAAVRTSSDLADGLVAVAESFLAAQVAGADDAEIYQVVVHAGTSVLTEPAAPAADPARCHVEDGPAISVSTAQMIGCTAALSWMTHGDGGAVLALGRRRRRPSSAIRRAARERDHGRCRFPGCESRRVDLHHIQHWVNGGRTDLENLISLCPYHHKVVHDRGYLIAAPPGSGEDFAFYRPDGTPLPDSPPLPEPGGGIAEAHDAAITPETIIPPWYGERLDLDHAIYVCFANARTEEQKQADREQAREPVFRPDTGVGDFSATVDYIRRYYDENPAA